MIKIIVAGKKTVNKIHHKHLNALLYMHTSTMLVYNVNTTSTIYWCFIVYIATCFGHTIWPSSGYP
jgi:hypothetical protein